MAYGTQTVRPVDVIVGPGNLYVATASAWWPRRERWACPPPSPGRPRSWWSPTPAPPPTYAALDLVVQAEHGPDGLAWLVTWSEDVADGRRAGDRAVRGRSRPAAPRSTATLDSGGLVRPRRWPGSGHGRVQPCRPRAPRADHRATPKPLVPLVRSAGAVFCGPLGAGQRGRLRGRAQPRPAHRPAAPASPSALGTQDFLKHRPRGHRGPGRLAPGGARGSPGRGRGLRRPRRSRSLYREAGPSGRTGRGPVPEARAVTRPTGVARPCPSPAPTSG